jgi:hypothetical protein
MRIRFSIASVIAVIVLAWSVSYGLRALDHGGHAQREARVTAHAALDAKCQTTGSGIMILPDDGCTPGAHAPVTEQIACTAALHPRKDPTTAQRHRAFKDYGVPYSDHAKYELDHRVPVFLHGLTTVKNLWPELNTASATGGGFIHNPKDALEAYVYRAICWSHKMTAAQGVAIFEGDWAKAYRKYGLG